MWYNHMRSPNMLILIAYWQYSERGSCVAKYNTGDANEPWKLLDRPCRTESVYLPAVCRIETAGKYERDLFKYYSKTSHMKHPMLPDLVVTLSFLLPTRSTLYSSRRIQCRFPMILFRLLYTFQSIPQSSCHRRRLLQQYNEPR